MSRRENDPEDLGRKATDVRRSQQQMYESLNELAETYEEGGIDSDEFMDKVGNIEDRFGIFIEGVEEDYDTVDEFASALNEDITSVSFHYHEAEGNEFGEYEPSGLLEKIGAWVVE